MTITITNDDLHTANEQLTTRIADLEREADTLAGECRDAQATAEQFANERDDTERELAAERTRADGLEAATVALVGDHIRRQDQLAAAAKTWRGIAARRQDQLAKAHAEIRDRDTTCWAMRDQLNRVAEENRDLRTELANQPRGWFRRNP